MIKVLILAVVKSFVSISQNEILYGANVPGAYYLNITPVLNLC